MAKNLTQAAPAEVFHATQELPPAMDYPEHEKTYHGFLAVTKYSIIALAAMLVFLYFVIRP